MINKFGFRVDHRLPRLTLVAICALMALPALFFLIQPNETRAVESLTLGRLAYGTRTFQFSGQTLFTLLTANADGTGVAPLAGSLPPPSQPSWSPDGAKVAFVGADAANEIYVINANGSNTVNLTQTPAIGESNPSWGANGKIAYERENQVWLMNQDGTGQAQFTPITQPTPTGPAFSLDGSQIAFASAGEIWKINADGSGEQRVTNNATTDSNPAWSPDGSKIVFQKGGVGIAVIDASGSNESNLTTNSGDGRPAWSSDGTTIAFKRNGSFQGIYVMDVTGANQTRIILDTGGPFGTTHDDPAWQPIGQAPNTFTISGRISGGGNLPTGVTISLKGSTNAVTTTDQLGGYQFSGLPAGGSFTVSAAKPNYYFTPPSKTFNGLAANQIADFVGKEVCVGANCAKNGRVAYVSGGQTIFSVNPNGTDTRQLTQGNFPDYSPDGTKVVFSTNRDGNNEIYEINADGTNPVRLTKNSASDIHPFYSPNGTSIVFTSDRDGNQEIYKMNADGSNQVRLTNETAADRMPAFSADGQKIIFVTERQGGSSNRRLYTMNADGTSQQVISDINGVYFRPSYRPDGAKIIFGYGQFEPMFDIWTMNPDGTGRTVFASNRVQNPSYSPDGARVAYTCCGNIEVDVNGIHLDGVRVSFSIADDWPTWQPTFAPRRTLYDFDGDARSDISLFRPSEGMWYLLRSQAGYAGGHWGSSTDVLAAADYDGDLKTDVAVFRPSEGRFYIVNSFDSTYRFEDFGTSGDVPLPTDWDGDSRADLTVYRAGAQGAFYYRPSMGNPNGNFTSIPWGTSGDKPVIGDYDADGRTDAAVYRPSEGVWYVRRSSNGTFFTNAFGISTDRPVPADYDGDGKTDVAVYRDGVWYLLRSTDGFLAFQYGIGTDIPVPADYDGDGRADAAVFRDGAWYRLKSTGGDDVVTFGTTGDKPIAAAP